MSKIDREHPDPQGLLQSRSGAMARWLTQRLLGDFHLPLEDVAFGRRFDRVMLAMVVASIVAAITGAVALEYWTELPSARTAIVWILSASVLVMCGTMTVTVVWTRKYRRKAG